MSKGGMSWAGLSMNTNLLREGRIGTFCALQAHTVLIVDDQSGAGRHAEPRMVVDPGDHLALGAVFEQSRSGFRPPSDPDRPGTGEAQ